MNESLVHSIYRRFTNSAIALATVLVIGTVGFHYIGGENTSFVDALYFTFITIATIGYGEIFDLTGKPGARIFTMLIGFAGIAVTTYIFSTLTAKQLNPACRVVARCHDINFFSKMSKVGADAIVSPDFTGGMRIVSSMIRPHVVSFLDNMLRSEGDLRVEEITVGTARDPVTIAQAAPVHRDYVVLAVKAGEQTLFNPPGTHQLVPGHVLVVMASPGGRQALEAVLG